MTSRVLLFACLVAAGPFIADARAQTPPAAAPAPSVTTPATAPAPTSSAAKREARKQMQAEKKAQRIAGRKKRVECYDEGKKQSLAGNALLSFVATCTKK
jgi:hypothetical protein